LKVYAEGQSIDVDLFLGESPYQAELLARRRKEAVDGLSVWFVSPEDLVLLKLLANRPRDLADIGDVLFTQGELDVPYMRRWGAELGVGARLDQVLRDAEAG
jgi:hypothetical protein